MYRKKYQSKKKMLKECLKIIRKKIHNSLIRYTLFIFKSQFKNV